MVSHTGEQFQTEAHPVRRGQSPRWLARITLAIVSVLLLSNLVAALFVAAYQVYYDGLIYPGVNVWGVELGGMSPEEAMQALDGRFDYPQTSTITFRDGGNVWPVSAGQLGVGFDVTRTIQAAYEVGRQPSLIASLRQQIAAWRDGVVVSPVIVYDQRVADVTLNEIAAAINRPPVDATVHVSGVEAVATPGQIGRQVVREQTVDRLREMIMSLQSGEITVAVEETPPQILSADEAAATINTILAANMQVVIENPYPDDPGPWTASRESLAGMIVIEQVAAGDGTASYAVRLDESQLQSFLNPLAPQLAREPVDARFDFDENSGTLIPTVNSQEGRHLDVAATIQQINQKLMSGEHTVPLVFETLSPAVPDTATAEELGIRELISSATTYYAGSSSERRANVATAASRFHGVMIPPGAEFSFNQYLGDVSVESGFESGIIIYNGRSIEGVGGGVCQVSTTAFQAAFYAGFPINERWPHGYWVGYYDSGEGKGMDATVYSPIVDLRFTNDMANYVLIETEVNSAAATITFRFYGTSDGRTVQKDGPYVSNTVPHGPSLYEENPELSPGTIEQVDYAVDGFDTTVHRSVYRDGQLLYNDTFFSQYMPWQAIYQVPPGEIPPGAPRVGQGG